VIFHFVLALLLLSIMRFNPWPLLVSISTLLVSVSFAVGSSASKYIEVRFKTDFRLCRNVRCTHAYVRALHLSLLTPSLRQGILFIALRRPYDLGDLIYMKDPSISNVDCDYSASWFIEGKVLALG
jgi:small-conductance mechanosensitive channel